MERNVLNRQLITIPVPETQVFYNQGGLGHFVIQLSLKIWACWVAAAYYSLIMPLDFYLLVTL
jgi:hypothetical protein